jgi:diguanylate cyclase (GGDEF)-like protein
VDYINHLDAMNPNINSSVLASWATMSQTRIDKETLIEQLQTTLDIEQLLTIYLSNIQYHFQITNVELDSYHGKFVAGQAEHGKHVLTLPIRINDRLMARLTYFSNKAISDVFMSSLTGYQKKLIYPLRNALAFWQLQHMAMRDPLTGIGNRNLFDDAYNRQILNAERYNESFVLMLLDLDNFKQVNDRFGHLSGDDVLTAFVALVQNCLRGSDQLFRFGGDEFAILLEKETIATADMVANRISQAINQHPLFLRYNVSTSIGCAAYQNGDTTTSLFARADKALYAAKDAGKNCMKIA